MLIVVRALLILMPAPALVTAGEVIAASSGESAALSPSSRGPAGVRPRRVSRYRDAAVEPATFRPSSEAKPLLAADWQPDGASSESPGAAGRESGAVAPSARASAVDSSRRLGVSSSSTLSARPSRAGLLDELSSLRLPAGSASTAAAAVAFVIGLAMLAAWAAKKTLPRSAQPLPSEAAEVLGRLRLGGKQTAQLVRVGRKLVLIHITAAGAETITEITDDADVQQLLAACEQGRGRGSAADFEDMLAKMGAEPAPAGFLGDQAGLAGGYDAQRLAAAYANTPGGRDHA